MAASTKDGHRWCRLLPTLPLPALAPPRDHYDMWEGMGGTMGAFRIFLQCHRAAPCLVMDSPCFPIPGGVVLHKGNKGRLAAY